MSALIRGIVKPVGEPGRAVTLERTLEGIRAHVGGQDVTIEMQHCGDYSVWCDEEGRLKELPFNVQAGPFELVGPVLFLGPTDAEGEETSLEPDVERDLLALLNDGTPYPRATP